MKFAALLDNKVIPRNIYVKWDKPKAGFIKLNTDGAMQGTNGPEGIAGAFRDCNGTWQMGFYGSLALINALEAELKAIRSRLQLAIQHNFTKLHIEMNSQEALESIITGKSLYDNVVFDCM